jgi:hypothetical protein
MRPHTQKAAFHYNRILDLKGYNTSKNRYSDQNLPQTVAAAAIDLSS